MSLVILFRLKNENLVRKILKGNQGSVSASIHSGHPCKQPQESKLWSMTNAINYSVAIIEL